MVRFCLVIGDHSSTAAAERLVADLCTSTTAKADSFHSVSSARRPFVAPQDLYIACVLPGYRGNSGDTLHEPAWELCRSDGVAARRIGRELADYGASASPPSSSAGPSTSVDASPCAQAARSVEALVRAAQLLLRPPQLASAAIAGLAPPAPIDPLARRLRRRRHDESAPYVLVDLVWVHPRGDAPSAGSLCVAPDSDAGLLLYGALRRLLLFGGEERAAAHFVECGDEAAGAVAGTCAGWSREWRRLLRAPPPGAGARDALRSLQWRGELFMHGHVLGVALHARGPFTPGLPPFVRTRARADGVSAAAGVDAAEARALLPPPAPLRAGSAARLGGFSAGTPALRMVRSARVTESSLRALLQMWAARSFELVGRERGGDALAAAWDVAMEHAPAPVATSPSEPRTTLVVVAVAARPSSGRRSRSARDGDERATFLLVRAARAAAAASPATSGEECSIRAYLLSRAGSLQVGTLVAASSVMLAGRGEDRSGGESSSAASTTSSREALQQVPLLSIDALLSEESRIARAQWEACAAAQESSSSSSNTTMTAAEFAAIALEVREQALRARQAEWDDRVNAMLKAKEVAAGAGKRALEGAAAEAVAAAAAAAAEAATAEAVRKAEPVAAVKPAPVARRRSSRGAAQSAKDAMFARRLAAGLITGSSSSSSGDGKKRRGGLEGGERKRGDDASSMSPQARRLAKRRKRGPTAAKRRAKPRAAKAEDDAEARSGWVADARGRVLLRELPLLAATSAACGASDGAIVSYDDLREAYLARLDKIEAAKDSASRLRGPPTKALAVLSRARLGVPSGRSGSASAAGSSGGYSASGVAPGDDLSGGGGGGSRGKTTRGRRASQLASSVANERKQHPLPQTRMLVPQTPSELAECFRIERHPRFGTPYAVVVKERRQGAANAATLRTLKLRSGVSYVHGAPARSCAVNYAQIAALESKGVAPPFAAFCADAQKGVGAAGVAGGGGGGGSESSSAGGLTFGG